MTSPRHPAPQPGTTTGHPLDATCIKCRTSHIPHAQYLAAGQYQHADSDRPKMADRPRFEGECLVMTCSVCGYQWAEPCADAAAAGRDTTGGDR